MNKKQVLILLLLTFAVLLFCAPINENTARRVAQNIALERSGQSKVIATVEPLEKDSNIYLVSFMPSGFVLIAGDDAAHPVLGYDIENKWSGDNMPVQLIDLIKSWKEQLAYIISNNLQADSSIRSEWGRLDVISESFIPLRNERDVSPLITSTWGQEGFYNDLCPSNTPVGCVATAMAQIMRYWAFPNIGQGSHSYNCPPYGTQTANFGSTTYNWAGMPNQVGSTNISVATISYHAGVAVDMQYDPTGSGAYSEDVPSALIDYFKYKTTAQHRNKNSYGAEAWNTMMVGELNNARPIYYSGSSTGSGGHAFILDGFSGIYPNTQFHVNWGWNGYYNGYFTLSALNPGGENFTSYQAAVTGVEPSASASQTLAEGFEGATFPPTGWTISDAAWTRTIASTYIITGTASAVCSGTFTQNGKRLRTPLLSIDGTIPLSFKGKSGPTNYNEAITVQYSSNGTTWSSLGTYTLTTTPQTFTQSLAALTPGSYYLGFLTANGLTTNVTKRYIIDDIAGPNFAPVAAVNITSWSAGNVTPGESISSGLTFQLSNTGGGILTISSVTNLNASEFKSTINTGIALVPGQVHEFGFTYDPLNYGTDNQTFQIVTNGGTLSITLSGQAIAYIFGDGFETYSDFSTSFAPWTQFDGDGFTTYSIQNYTFPNQGYTGSYIIFNASQTVPSLAGTPADAYSGSKGAYCFAGTSAPNNDWLISPLLNLTGPTCTVSFWAKSYTDQYGLERFKVRYSTTNNTSTSFTSYLAGSATAYISAPITWTYYSYTLPVTAKYVAIQCVSNDAFIFMVDSFVVTDSGYSPPTPTFGNVSGYVYKFGTTTPISNAYVTIGTKTAITNGSGFYQINNLVVGTYSANCTTPGADFFNGSVSGIVVTNGGTANQNFYLKWSELAVNATSFTSSLYPGETEYHNLQISNPGGTADLAYSMYLTPNTAAANPRTGTNLERSVPAAENHRIPELIAPQSRVAVEGSIYYGNVDDAAYYTTYALERATKFTIADFGLWSNSGVTISELEAWFYQPTTLLWGTEETFRFKIYGANGTTVLYTSPFVAAVPNDATYIYPTTFTLPTPITVAGDFWVAVVPEGTTTGSPYGLSTDYSYGCSYYGSAGTWTALGEEEHLISAFINGNWWVSKSATYGYVVPGGTNDVTLGFDTTDLSTGTYRGFLTLYNNSDYIAPPPGTIRGDNLVIPFTLNVLAATSATPILNYSGLEAVANSGSSAESGDVFTLTNIGPGTLTIISASGLAGTPFTTNFNTSISLNQNGSYNFGFTFAPTSVGTFNATFTIVTNGGTKTISLQGYAGYIAESFEDVSFPPLGWTSFNSDGDAYNWYQFNNPTYAFSGNSCAASDSWVADRPTGLIEKTNTRGALTPDNYLITPQLGVVTGDKFTWWVGAIDESWPQEHYRVLLSTTTNHISQFTQVLFSETLADDAWHYRSVDLSPYAGQAVYIAIRHYNCTDQYKIMIDDVLMPRIYSVPGADIPENIAIVLSGTQNITVSWDPGDNAAYYHVYVSNAPYGAFNPVAETEEYSATFTPAQLAAAGITGSMCFFQVTSDSEPMRFTVTRSDSSTNKNTKIRLIPVTE